MAARIRLTRFGGKKNPFYRVIVADSESPRDGRFIEQLGTYDPTLKDNKVQLKEDRVKYWLSQGAKPSVTVGGILKKLGYFGK